MNEMEVLIERMHYILKNLKGWKEHHLAQVELELMSSYLSGNYEYADNLRIARDWISVEKVKYEEKKSRGCCGSYDIILTTSECLSIYFGFNYGH